MKLRIKDGEILDTENFYEIEYGQYHILYSGIVFVRGLKAGEESIKVIVDHYEAYKNIDFIKIYGAFTLILKKNDTVIVFTDNSNMHCFYYSDTIIADRFLSTLQSGSKFNDETLCEFIELGTVNYGNTVIDGVRISLSNNYYVIRNGLLQPKDKEIGGIDGPTTITDVQHFFNDIAYALTSYNVGISLTGGFDSRLVFACLSSNLDLFPMICGANENESDVKISKSVAKVVGKESKALILGKPAFSDLLLEDLFDYSDGGFPFINSGTFRNYSIKKFSIDNGLNVHLTGDGGVLHKDWEWQQDFPFYRKRGADSNKFYQQRIKIINHNIPWGARLRNISEENYIKHINNLDSLKYTLNTECYDNWYFNYTGNKLTRNYSRSQRDYCLYAPLFEMDLIRYSFALPRRKRFFNNSIRDVTSGANKEIADLPTSYGTTSSNNGFLKFRDVFYQCADYGRKAIRLIGRKYFKKALMQDDAVYWNFNKDIRESMYSLEAFNYAKEEGYIDSGCSMDECSNDTLERLVTLLFIKRYIDGVR